MSTLLLHQTVLSLASGVPTVMSAVWMPTDDHWYDALNPFGYLGSAAGKVVADGWTAAMLGLWNAGLWMLRLVLKIMDTFLTPDISGNGPGQAVYATTFWIAGALVVMLAMIQLGVAAFRRDGRALATVVIGVGQFAIVWSAWIAYGTVVVAACGGLTRALMQALLKVNSWSAWQPWSAFTTADITDGTVATVLGLLGMLLWLAAIGHLLVMLARAGALMVLVATTPISAAGLVGDAGRSWFWKSLRWFHAAALTPVLTVLVLGIGVQMTTGVANGLTGDKMQQAIGTAVPGVVLILIGCFAPLALFKLLAFVDPSTASGAAMRQGLTANGGLQGLLGGKGPAAGGAGGGTSSAASSTDEVGRSAGESGAEDATTGRFQGILGGLGTAGQVASKGLGVMASVGSKGAALGSDLTNQMGVGAHSYQPDFSGIGGRARSSSGSGGSTGQGPRGGSPQADADPSTDPGGSSNDDGRLDTGNVTPAMPPAGPTGPPATPPATPPTPPTPSEPSAPAASGCGNGKRPGGPPASGAAAGAGGGAEAAAAVAV